MKRDSIDAAVLAQLDRRETLLRDVARSGGKDCWSHLHSHGHKYPSVRHAINHGYLKEVRAYEYELTEAGRQYVESSAIPPAMLRTGAE